MNFAGMTEQEYTDEILQHFKDCIKFVFNDDEKEKYFLNWLAFIVQKQGFKLRHCLVLQSYDLELSGINMLLEIIKSLLGEHNTKNIKHFQVGRCNTRLNTILNFIHIPNKLTRDKSLEFLNNIKHCMEYNFTIHNDRTYENYIITSEHKNFITSEYLYNYTSRVWALFSQWQEDNLRDFSNIKNGGININFSDYEYMQGFLLTQHKVWYIINHATYFLEKGLQGITDAREYIENKMYGFEDSKDTIQMLKFTQNKY